MLLPTAFAAITGLLASAWDLRTRRLPNLLTFGSAAVALFYFLIAEGLNGAGWSLAGWAVGCALLLPVFWLRGMGAGDVKLLAAFGAWLGPSLVFWTAIYGAIAGGVLAVVVALAHGYLGQAWANVKYAVWYWMSLGPAPVPALTLSDAHGPRLPYSVPLAVGMCLALWLR